MLEIKLPWMSIMGKAATPGQLIGFDVWINDDDNGGDRDSQVSWHSTDGNGWQDPSVWAVALLEASNKAANPSPANGAIYGDTWVTLSWLAAPSAVSHDVYFGESFADVEAGTGGTFRGNQAAHIMWPAFPDSPIRTVWFRARRITGESTKSMPLIRTAHGKVMCGVLSVPPKKAYKPNPPDGSKFMDPAVTTLSWTAGFGAKIHTVYFGDNFDTVSNADSGVHHRSGNS